jgi:transcriptional regulator with XRE-family HTH domain
MDVHIGSRLKARRIVNNLTQERLAEQLGVSFQQLHKYESGSNRISSSMLYRAAKALGVSIQYFFTDAVEIAEPPARQRDRTIFETARLLSRIQDDRVRENLHALIMVLAGVHGDESE